jgi:hypothetical protein
MFFGGSSSETCLKQVLVASGCKAAKNISTLGIRGRCQHHPLALEAIMLCTSRSQAPRKAKPTDLQGRHENDQDNRIPTTALRWKSTRHFLFFAIAVSTVALTALSRCPQCLFYQPNFQPWRSHLFASLTLKDGFPLSTLETILLSEPNASCAAD